MGMSLYQTTGQNDPQAIGQLVEELQPARVLVVGGDGTITMVAEVLQGRDTVLGIVPAGSANGLATSFGLPAGLDETLDVALGPHVGCIDGVRINGKMSLHLSDLGLNALLVKNYEEGEIRGKLGYAKEVVKTLAEHEIFRVRITTPEQSLETLLASRMRKTVKRFRFDLTNALARHAVDLTDFLEGHFGLAPYPEAHPDHISLTFRQIGQCVCHDSFGFCLVEGIHF